MNLEKLRAFCASLPQATSGIKWGADLCVTINTKMFAVFSVEEDRKAGNVSFKPAVVADTILPGVHPLE